MDYNDYTQTTTAPSVFPSTGFLIGELVFAIIIIVAGWRIFEKAKKPGWAILIPFYNIYIMLKIVGRPGWWLILFFIPIVNFIIHLIVALNLAKSFKRSTAFGIFFLWLFPIIGFLVLGFGKSKYNGPSVKK